MKKKVLATIVTVVIVAIALVSAAVASDFVGKDEEEIKRKTRWIEVPGDPFELNGYTAEGQDTSVPFSFPEPYISYIQVFLVWQDDMRTEPDTFNFVVFDQWDRQVMAGGSNAGTTQMQTWLNNTEVNHVENNEGWTVVITCYEAKDGYIFPGGFFTIQDDGNDWTFRIEYKHFIEHNPEWE